MNDVYYSVSRFGKFVFRTDVFGAGDLGQAEVQAGIALRDAFKAADGWEIQRNVRSAVWTSNQVEN